MRYLLLIFGLLSTYCQLFSSINDSILPYMGIASSSNLEEVELHLLQNHKLRVMTYNMLYNLKEAEDKLPLNQRWEYRKPRLLQYLAFAEADIIGSQELQEDQLHEIMECLGSRYRCCGEKTRENEGRSDINAIFFNKHRLTLVESQTVRYIDLCYQNAFTFCKFIDNLTGNKFVVVNTKLTWGDVNRRLSEAIQLGRFSELFSSEEAIVILGDFNTVPFISNRIEQALCGREFKDARKRAIFGHFGPFYSVAGVAALKPFFGSRLPFFILDHIFVNDRVVVLTHGIDPAKVDDEFPSDHFPVITDLMFFVAH